MYIDMPNEIGFVREKDENGYAIHDPQCHHGTPIVFML